MKKIIIIGALLAASLAQAEGVYTSITYDVKDKVASPQNNYVYGLNVGYKFSDGVTVEARMEDERVEPGAGATQKQEGLGQLKLTKDFATGTMLTPYVAAAVGHKNKSTIDFPFYLYELGLKVKLNDTFNVRVGSRQRTASDNNTTNSYDTRETTLALGVNISKNDSISFAVKQERGTSNYDTKGFVFTHSF